METAIVCSVLPQGLAELSRLLGRHDDSHTPGLEVGHSFVQLVNALTHRMSHTPGLEVGHGFVQLVNALTHIMNHFSGTMN